MSDIGLPFAGLARPYHGGRRLRGSLPIRLITAQPPAPPASLAVEKIDMGPGSKPRARFAAHIVDMTDGRQLTFKIVRDPDAGTRFRWLIYAGFRFVASSPRSFATLREAEADVGKAMLRLAVQGGAR
jgi:hypothetical protein